MAVTMGLRGGGYFASCNRGLHAEIVWFPVRGRLPPVCWPVCCSAWPQQSLFVGEPLAAPFARVSRVSRVRP
jgi:hypothetical protein